MSVRREIVEQVDGLAIVTTQDVEAILDNNKRLQNSGDGFTPSREMRHIAEIPIVVIEDWFTRFGVNVFDPNHEPAVRRLLNDPDWRWLRTSPGRA